MQIIIFLLLTLPVSYAQQQQPDLPPPLKWQLVHTDSASGDTIQTQWSDTRSRIKSYYSGIVPSTLLTGILPESDLPVISIAKYNGAVADSLILGTDKVFELYSFLQEAAVDTTRRLAEFDTTLLRPYDDTDTIPFLFVLSRYDVLKSTAVDSGLIGIDTVNKRFVSLNPPPAESPFETRTAIAGAPAQALFKAGSTVSFGFPSGLFVSNVGTPDSIRVNFDDGVGFRSVNLNDVVSVTLSDTNRVHDVVAQVYAGGSSYSFTAPVATVEPGIEFYAPTVPYETVVITTTNRPEGEPGTSVCTLYVNRHPCHEQLTKPFIVVEGFEPPEFVKRNLDENVHEFKERFDRLNMPIPSDGLIANWMRQEQYDLVYVEWNDNIDPARGGNPLSHGADHIRNNAELLKEVIRWVNAQKATAPEHEREQNVVYAQSMGGLVARIALAEMENVSAGTNEHDTRLYFSVDTPHEGANIPIGLQQMINDVYHFTNHHHPRLDRLRRKLQFFIKWAGEHKHTKEMLENMKSTSVFAKDMLDALHRPAAKELLIYHVATSTDPFVLPHHLPERTELHNRLDNIGMPQFTQNISLCDGSEEGMTQGITSSLLATVYIREHKSDSKDFLIDISAYRLERNNSPFYQQIYHRKLRTRVLPFDNTYEERSYHVSDSYAYDNAPGGSYLASSFATSDEIRVLASSFCFIPSFSSLNIPFSRMPLSTTNIYAPLLSLNPMSPTLMATHEFDDYRAGSEFNPPPTDLNNRHFFLFGFKHRDIFTQRMGLGPNTIPNIDGSFNLLSNFNYTELTTDKIPRVDVNAGRILGFNLNAAGGSGTLPFPVAGRKRFYTHQIANPCVDLGVEIGVFNGGQFNIGDASTPSPNNEADVYIVGNSTFMFVDVNGQVNVRRGSRLIVDNGAELRLSNGQLNVEDGASVEIRPGGKLEISNSPTINLIGTNSRLLLNGEVVINSDSRLQPTGNGFVEVRNPNTWSNFSAFSPNSRIILNGSGAGDEVLRVSQGTFFVPNGLREFTVTNGKVNLAANSQVDVVGVNGAADQITLQNASVEPLNTAARTTHRGIRLRGQQNVTVNNVTFLEGAVGLTNNQEINNSPFTISNCTFDYNTVGLRTTGREITMNNCNFINFNNIGWEATSITGSSTINDCNFSECDQAVLINSGSQQYFNRCVFNQNNYGITGTSTSIYPTCCQFNGQITAIRAQDATALFLSNNARNIFNAGSARPSPDVLFGNAFWFELENGNNSFSQYTSPSVLNHIHFSGTFNNPTAYCPGGTTINANGNRFGTTGLITMPNYNLFQSCPPVMGVIFLNQTIVASSQCGQGGPGGGNNGGGPGQGGGRLAADASANNSGQGVSEVSVYPSPFTESFSLAFSLDTDAQVTVELCNALGQTVRTTASAYAAGSHTMAIDGQGLAGGAYFAKIFVNGAVVKTVPVMKAN